MKCYNTACKNFGQHRKTRCNYYTDNEIETCPRYVDTDPLQDIRDDISNIKETLNIILAQIQQTHQPQLRSSHVIDFNNLGGEDIFISGNSSTYIGTPVDESNDSNVCNIWTCPDYNISHDNHCSIWSDLESCDKYLNNI